MKLLLDVDDFGGVTGDVLKNWSSHDDDIAGVRCDNDETDDAVDSLWDSSSNGWDVVAISPGQRRRFDKTVDFWTNDAITKALPVAWK